jgi:hypothetical protein
MSTPQIFLTDYASYNNGTQFEFGHWVDLTDFSDESELLEYISNHFAECDKQSPLDEYGSVREETMITDYEGFPEEFYSESGCQWTKIFKYLELDFDNMSDSDKMAKWNEYCEAQNYEPIYEFDEEFFNMFFANKPMESARAVKFGDVNWAHSYIRFDGSGNLESLENATDTIDEGALIDWLMENL